VRRRPGPGWRRLVLHSYRLGLRRLPAAALRRDRRHLRQALYRVLVPLEPWRFHELGWTAEHDFAGRWLDVGSPKLLPSLLRREGRGEWVAIDLLEEEVDLWRALDPALDARVADARELPFEDGAFDGAICVSVIEHVPDEGDEAGDAQAMAELWRVLRPGGVLLLTTNVAARAREVLSAAPVYGDASPAVGELAFFERQYDEEALARRLLGLPWDELGRGYVRERLPIHRRFFAARPLSFLAGGLLALVCPWNFARIPGPSALPEGVHGVVALTLRKPAGAP
jgi:SAM-dependent methyltransferase